VSLLRRPGFRLLVEAVAIVLAAVIAGVRHVGAAGIIAAVAVVWVIVALIEYSLARPRERRRRPAPAAPQALPVEEPPSETVRVLPPRPPFEVAVEPESEPQPEPEPEPVAAEPRQWNLWELERAVRDRGEPSEEQEFLLLYLRDYADPAGLLPLDFDDLVRESFGDTLEAVVG